MAFECRIAPSAQCLIRMQASSSIGRASVSKTEGWGFESLLACQINDAGSKADGVLDGHD